MFLEIPPMTLKSPNPSYFISIFSVPKVWGDKHELWSMNVWGFGPKGVTADLCEFGQPHT